jgi:3-hydroxyisobutyrate dehydrogenase-like beta-hydroxyacid dehydrogenase
MDIGYVGPGGMGHAMASNLIGKGHALRVWNRSPGKAADLVAQGATLGEHQDRGELDWTAAALNVSEEAGLRG